MILIDESTVLQELPKRALVRLANELEEPWRHLSHNGMTFNVGRWTANGCRVTSYQGSEAVRSALLGGTLFTNAEITELAHLPVASIRRDDHESWRHVVAMLEKQWPIAPDEDAPEDLSEDSSTTDIHSGRTRVAPIFGRLQESGGPEWGDRLLNASEGIRVEKRIGRVSRCVWNPEVAVPASAMRLLWMIKNAQLLIPSNARQWDVYRTRVGNHPRLDETVLRLAEGNRDGVPTDLILEGSTRCDCLIEGEHAIIWVEGKRFDWLSPGIRWDITRDQLARNLDAAMRLAAQLGKNFYFLLCHEGTLRHHETCLIEGYRNCTWSAGLPHLTADERRTVGDRIGTITWSRLCRELEVPL